MSEKPPAFVLVDYENVQDLDFERLRGLPVTVVLFAGPNQKKVPMELLRAALQSGLKMDIVQTEFGGSNALDFVIAYHAGVLLAGTPGASLHLVSRDTGFDALVRHLRGAGRGAERAGTIGELRLAGPVVKPAAKVVAEVNPAPPAAAAVARPGAGHRVLAAARNALAAERAARGGGAVAGAPGDLVALAEDFLARAGRNRPRKLRTLCTSLAARFPRPVTPAEMDGIVEALVRGGVVRVGANDNLSYRHA